MADSTNDQSGALAHSLRSVALHSSSVATVGTIADGTASQANASNVPSTDPSVDLLAARWKEALERCKTRLGTHFNSVSEFNSPDKLLSDLNRRAQGEWGSAGTSRVLSAINLTSRSLGLIVTQFVSLMMPQSVATGVLWGTLHLVFLFAGNHTHNNQKANGPALESLTEICFAVRNQLAKLNFYIAGIKRDESTEVRLAILDFFEALIDLWVYASLQFKKGIKAPLASSTDKNPGDPLREAMNKIHAATEHLKVFTSRSSSQSPDYDHLPGLGGREDLSEVKFPIYLFLPASKTKLFVGRDPYLKQLYEYFNDNQAPAFSEPLKVFSIWGLGGVGKTELALKFANQNRASYDAVFWLRSDTRTSLEHGFTKIAVSLQLPRAQRTADHETNEYNAAAVKGWLNTTEKKWLLILDNVEESKDLEDFLPYGCNGNVLLTTRYSSVARATQQPSLRVESSLRVEPFNTEETQKDAQLLFEKLLGWGDDEVIHPSQRQAASKILAYMDGLALGIHHMAALITFRKQSRKLEKFLKNYEENPGGYNAKWQKDAPGPTLQTLWQMTFQQLREKRLLSNAVTVLGVLSCLNPDAISIELFTSLETDRCQDTLRFCNNSFKVEDAIDSLEMLSLVDRDDEVLSLHRLVQSAFLHDPETDKQLAFVNAATLINTAFPKQVKGRWLYGEWKRCQANLKHVLSLVHCYENHQRQETPVMASEDFIELLSNCTWYLGEIESHWDVLDLVKVAKRACENKHSIWYAHLLNTEAMSYFSVNQLEESREPLEESRKIREDLLPENDEELGNNYNNLGIVESGQGNVELALEYFKQAQKTREGRPEAETSVATSFINSGRACFLKQDYETAVSDYKQAQIRYERNFGVDSFPMQGIHFSLGNVYLATREFGKARKSYMTAKSIIFELNPVHIYLTSVCYKLGCVELGAGNYAASLDFLDEGLAIARARGRDGRGEEARILRKKAVLFDTVNALSSTEKDRLGELVDVSQFGTINTAEQMRGRAEQLRSEIMGNAYDPLVADEENAYDRLIYPFKR